MFANDWDLLLKDEVNKEYFVNLMENLDILYENDVVHPKKSEIFRAFRLVSYSNTKVVILGQDPYHGQNQANGLAFSVNTGEKLPPSLRNIYKEIEQEFNVKMSDNGDLTPWASQGVLLLNSVLAVKANSAGSLKDIGFTTFTDKIIEILNNKTEPTVFVLWGNYAKSKQKLITNHHHLVLTSNHPSPLSAYRGFFGNNHFIKIKEFLYKNYNYTINFTI